MLKTAKYKGNPTTGGTPDANIEPFGSGPGETGTRSSPACNLTDCMYDEKGLFVIELWSTL
jgi:hypothetical protein